MRPEERFPVLFGRISAETWACMVQHGTLSTLGISLAGIGVDSIAAARAPVDEYLT